MKRTQPPRTLGRYEVGAKIGGGGMATVYVGRDVRPDGSEELVALKVIREELADDEQFSAMFIDEAKILARLSHPNVIQTLEYGIEGNDPFIAMELLNGRTLADVWDVLSASRDTIDLGVASWICARVAEGVHSAHELVAEDGQPLSVIHRDVNPSNIFLTYSGEVKLIDFGLARARVRVAKSVEGIVKGKIPYLAPEQVHGRPIDRRIDVYALGTTLWELVSMRRLFKRDNDIETLKAIREALVPDLRRDIPGFPDPLWHAIERALREDADQRYATAEELRADLDAFARATAPHAPNVAALVSRLFPGGEARQAQWLRDAASVRVPDLRTRPPPAPVPIASSSLLDERQPPSLRSAPAGDLSIPPPPKVPSDKGDPPAEARAAPEASAPAPAVQSASTPPKRRKAKKNAQRANVHRKPKVPLASRPSDDVRRATPAEPAQREDTARLWMIVVSAVVVLFALALMASR